MYIIIIYTILYVVRQSKHRTKITYNAGKFTQTFTFYIIMIMTQKATQISTKNKNETNKYTKSCLFFFL